MSKGVVEGAEGSSGPGGGAGLGCFFFAIVCGSSRMGDWIERREDERALQLFKVDMVEGWRRARWRGGNRVD